MPLSVRSASQRGFTLTELVAVVAIMSILAVIGMSSVRGHLSKAGSVEVRATIQAIAAAQERYRAENGQYLSTSPNLTTLYPMADPGASKVAFYGWSAEKDTDTMAKRWERLRPDIADGVTFGYACVAGLPGQDYPDTSLTTEPPWPAATTSPWYFIQAIGDRDGDDVNAVAVRSSFIHEIYWENEEE